MNPYRLKNVFEYLTSNNQLLKKKLKLGTDDVPIPPKRDDVTTIEAINRFNKANPRLDVNDIQPVVKQSAIKQSNVGEVDEGVIQGAFDTATMEARDGGYPPPIYEAFKKRYLKRNMKADGGRAGYEDGGMLVQPSDDGSRPGYAIDKRNDNYRVSGERGGKTYRQWAKENNLPQTFSNKKEAEAAQEKFYKAVPKKTDTSKTKWVDEITTLSNEFKTKIIKDFDN